MELSSCNIEEILIFSQTKAFLKRQETKILNKPLTFQEVTQSKILFL